jgi:hypothetical protein
LRGESVRDFILWYFGSQVLLFKKLLQSTFPSSSIDIPPGSACRRAELVF